MKNLSSREVIVSLILVFAILGIFLFTDILSKTGKGTEFPPDPGAPSAEAADIKVSIGTLTGLPRVGEEYLIPVIVANDGSMDSENPLTLKLLVYNEAKSNFEERKVVSNVGPIKEGSRISLNIPYIRSTDDLSLTTKRILIKVVAESAEIDLNLQNNEKEFAFEQQRAELKLEVGAVRKGKSTPVIPVRVSNIGNLDYTSNIVTKFILNLNNFGEMILAETTIPSLSAGSFKDFELEFSPVNEDFLQPGKYSGLYVISNGIRSPISADSVLAAQATQPATQTALTGPDLKLELGTIGKATVNTAYEIPVTIRNIGGTSTSKSISVQYDLYDTATSTWKPHGQAVTITNPIAPGASTTAKLIFPAKSATGKYSLWAILTSAEDVNGANNDAMFDLEVALGSIDVKAEVTTLPQTFVIGQRMAIPIKLTNIGT
ncbi:hypothetical protein J4401_07565, partial [Candidatus Woesearchaeota archaeon]|nr:hypothetical protein [Candidatus Woesearchaeota archaeon]